jgi:nitrogen regulatory protein P-II 1
MKIIEAIIRPVKLAEVNVAMQELGIEEMMESEIISHGSKTEEIMSYRGAEYATDFIKKIKIEIIAADSLVAKVVKTIRDIAGTGRKEDCRIFILSFIEAY